MKNNLHYDKIYIFDTSEERSLLLENCVKYFADQIETHLLSIQKCTQIQDKFREKLQKELASGQAIMVFFNVISGVKGQILDILYGLETSEDTKTRKIMVSCKSTQQINKGFKKRGLDRSRFKHIVCDNEDHYLTEVEELFMNI